MLWLVFDSRKWKPNESEAADLLGKAVSFRLIERFEEHPEHPLFSLLYYVDGLLAFNFGVIEVDSEEDTLLAEGSSLLADDRILYAFGSFDGADLQNCLIHLHKYSLAQSTAGDVLSMIGFLQGARQKMAACGKLDPWRVKIDTVAEILSEITEDLHFNRDQSISELIAPLNPRKTK